MPFDKNGKIIQGERTLFQQMVMGKLDIHILKNEVGPLPNTI